VLINPFLLELVERKGTGKKLMQRHLGPFEVTKVISPTVYHLRLPDSYGMHNVLNVEHLRPYRRAPEEDRPYLSNPRDMVPVSEEYGVDCIVAEERRKGKPYYRVHWTGYNVENDTWQTAYNM
jgi:hypothetical protein